MLSILYKTSVYICIILLGFLLRRIHFFEEEHFLILSKITIRITLPAAIVVNFSSAELSLAMLQYTLMGFGSCVLLMVLAYLSCRGKGKEEKSFSVLNITGYNIGTFTLPFIQGFMGPTSVVTACLYDTGNSIICLGGAYGVASMIQRGTFSLKRLLGTMLRSVPLMTYILMTILTLLSLRLPAFVLSYAEAIASANVFMAMLMLGVGLRIPPKRAQLGQIFRILSIRYVVAIVLALAFYFLLPYEAAVRQALVLLALGPIAVAATGFTADLKLDFGLSTAINSMSILISLLLMMLSLMLML